MRRADAPPPGWYPDPTGGSQLWWWDGLDWTDHRRAPPGTSRSEVPADVGGTRGAAEEPPGELSSMVPGRSSVPRTRDETAEIMAEVRRVAKDEVDRAVHLMSDRARDATRRLEPLISQYGDRLLKWIRNIGIIAIGLVVLWLVLQTVTQASLMTWVGDRIDSIFGGWATPPVGAPGIPAGGG